MHWTKIDDKTWEADDGVHLALARQTATAGVRAQIFARPLQLPMFEEQAPVPVGFPRWAEDFESAIRQVIHRFDPEAELPHREQILP